MAAHVSTKRWQDPLILLLGLWLFITPWVFQYPIPSSVAWNALMSGAVIAALAAYDLFQTYFWAVVLNLALGLWVAVSPWVLPAAELRSQQLMWNDVAVGLAVAVLAVWEMRTDPELRTHWPGAARP